MNASSIPHPARRKERGYILLTLLLMVALLIVAAAAVLPPISFEIRRDREEELIHRGVQYSRAIRTYYKKFGRYPTRIEELESTNNLRFLRKRYKDPITGKDFKLLHFGEVKLTFSGGVGGASNLNPAGGSPLGGISPLNAQGALGSPSGAPAAGTLSPSPQGTTSQNQAPDASQSVQSQPGQSGQQPQQQSDSSSKDQLSGQTFGGGPIVGVISTSKKDSIREFNHKKKYSEWQFIYDPATDRGGLLNTPNQPPLQGFGNQSGQTVQQGSPNNSIFGPQPGQGNYPGQMNPNPTNPTSPGSPTQPPSNPPNQ
jgi:type II secretory pathway pseudopilin PulG